MQKIKMIKGDMGVSKYGKTIAVTDEQIIPGDHIQFSPTTREWIVSSEMSDGHYTLSPANSGPTKAELSLYSEGEDEDEYVDRTPWQKGDDLD